jgi:two-component system sensor histidine kinase DegS
MQLQEEERLRLAHSLMQGPGQVLANALMELEFSLPLLEKNPQVAITGLDALRHELRVGLAQLKSYVAELQPPLLEEMGLGASIHQYVRAFSARTGIRAACQGCERFDERYPTTIEVTLFRILQEALKNVETHAKATAVRVELTKRATQLRLSIQDNGRGFTPRTQQLPKKRQFGLIVMRDRAELLGGQMQLFSEHGRGVRLIVTIPYHGHADEAANQRGTSHERTNHDRSRGQRTGDGTGKGQERERKSNSKGRSKSPRSKAGAPHHE